MNPVLYILMRKDIHSLAGGKGMAQAAHAANQFVEETTKNKLFKAWQGQAGTFGTTIVVGVDDLDRLEYEIDRARELGLSAGLTVDPTFPVRDGDAVLLANVTVCGYVFGDKNKTYKDTTSDWSDHHVGLGEEWGLVDFPLYPTLDFPEESDY